MTEIRKSSSVFVPKVSNKPSFKSIATAVGVGVLTVAAKASGAAIDPQPANIGRSMLQTPGKVPARREFCNTYFKAADSSASTAAQELANVCSSLDLNEDFVDQMHNMQAYANKTSPFSVVGTWVVGVGQNISQVPWTARFVNSFQNASRYACTPFWPRKEGPVAGCVVKAEEVSAAPSRTVWRALANAFASLNPLNATAFNAAPSSEQQKDPTMVHNLVGTTNVSSDYQVNSVGYSFKLAVRNLGSADHEHPQLRAFPEGESYASDGPWPKDSVRLAEKAVLMNLNTTTGESVRQFATRLKSEQSAKSLETDASANALQYVDTASRFLLSSHARND